MGSRKVHVVTQEFLERTDTAGNIVYTTKTGERINMEPVETKNKDVVATMTFPSEQLIEMFKDYTMTEDQVEELISNYDFDDVISSSIDDIDWNDKVTDVLSDINVEDYLDEDRIANNVVENLDYSDIAREVKDYLDEPDAVALAEELLTSFNYDGPCHTGRLYIKSVEAIIEGYMKKQTEGIVQPTVIEENKETILTYTVKEINEVLESLQYTEYNKSRILTALSLKERG
jgi:hypothetical protein